jgi:hypothetical protein
MKRFNSTCFNFSSNYISLLIIGREGFPVKRLGVLEQDLVQNEASKKTAFWGIFRLAAT